MHNTTVLHPCIFLTGIQVIGYEKLTVWPPLSKPPPFNIAVKVILLSQRRYKHNNQPRYVSY